MDRFLDTYDHSKLNWENINHLNRSITQNEIETAIKSLSKKKSPGPDGTQLNSIRPLKKKILHKLFHEIEREGTLHNIFYEANITFIPKPDKDTSKEENYRPISLMRINAKILNGKPNPTTYQKHYSQWPSWLHPMDAGVVQHMEIYKYYTAHL
jgi:hypothetical protein